MRTTVLESIKKADVLQAIDRVKDKELHSYWRGSYLKVYRWLLPDQRLLVVTADWSTVGNVSAFIAGKRDKDNNPLEPDRHYFSYTVMQPSFGAIVKHLDQVFDAEV